MLATIVECMKTISSSIKRMARLLVAREAHACLAVSRLDLDDLDGGRSTICFLDQDGGSFGQRDDAPPFSCC